MRRSPASPAVPFPGLLLGHLENATTLRGAALDRQVTRVFDNPASAAGFLLTDFEFAPLYANQAAMQILCFEEDRAATRHFMGFAQRRIRSIVHVRHFTTEVPAAMFASGRRRYVCRPVLVDAALAAIMLEREVRSSLTLLEICRRFHLSPRESETIRHLSEGLTTKEIALRMGVSPNTVKQFVRLTMSKMGVTTRSGILGKLITC